MSLPMATPTSTTRSELGSRGTRRRLSRGASSRTRPSSRTTRCVPPYSSGSRSFRLIRTQEAGVRFISLLDLTTVNIRWFCEHTEASACHFKFVQDVLRKGVAVCNCKAENHGERFCNSVGGVVTMTMVINFWLLVEPVLSSQKLKKALQVTIVAVAIYVYLYYF